MSREPRDAPPALPEGTENPFEPPQAADEPAADQASAPAEEPRAAPRLVKLPLALFAITAVMTFWVGAIFLGANSFSPIWYLFDGRAGPKVLAALQEHWGEGLTYMACLMGILLAHEMGHFIATLRHRIPASLPFFIPMPIGFFGTMGAVISMQGSKADRKQLFDIGLAGPLAGLVVAAPILYWGIMTAKPVDPASGPTSIIFHDPLLVKLLIYWLRPDVTTGELYLNPMLYAGWVGLLITGLNMLPVSQLDGGHVTYALFGRGAHWIARAFIFAAIAYVVVSGTYFWSLMIVLVTLIGVDHPPTRNDRAHLGPLRVTLGFLSLAIPILCFPPQGITIFGQ